VTSLRDPRLAAEATSADQWFAAARQPFDAAQPRSAMRPELLECFRGAQVVGIGEASHGTHEDVLFKAELVLALVDAGLVDTLYLEANHAGAAQIDAHVHGAGDDTRQAVRDAPIFRVLKTEAFVACIEGLRARARRGVAVHVVGIDCQDSARDADLALRRLALRDAQAADEFRAQLAPITGAAAAAVRHPDLVRSLLLKTMDECSAVLERLEQACGADEEAAQAARRARQGLVAMRIEAKDARDEDFDWDSFSWRDRYMAENILAHGSRGVFWGHNFHVAGGSPRGQLEGYEPTGSVLRRKLEWRYRTVLFDYGTARISVVVPPSDDAPPDATQPAEVVVRDILPGSLAEAVRGGTGGSCWIDMGKLPQAWYEWRETPRPTDWPGFAARRERVPEELAALPFDALGDVLVVIDNLSAARSLASPNGS
jgi:erythromycin esterase